MKNLIIAVIGIAIAVILYTQLQKDNVSITDSTPAEMSAPEADTTAPAASAPVAAPVAAIPESLISAAPDNAAVFIEEPADGATVTSPVTVKFGIANMTIAPAGDNTEYSGHHHILIDQQELPDLTQPIPATDEIIHFGTGQTETTLELEPGEHTLQLLLGNYLHIPHDKPVVSEKITIIVE